MKHDRIQPFCVENRDMRIELKDMALNQYPPFDWQDSYAVTVPTGHKDLLLRNMEQVIPFKMLQLSAPFIDPHHGTISKILSVACVPLRMLVESSQSLWHQRKKNFPRERRPTRDPLGPFEECPLWVRHCGIPHAKNECKRDFTTFQGSQQHLGV